MTKERGPRTTSLPDTNPYCPITAGNMDAGQVSVLDYITVLRSKIQTEKDRLLLRTNKQLVIAAYNYWNW